MSNRAPRATADFETRSACSLRKTGSWRYSLDPTTEVLCLAYRLPHWKPGRTELWHPAFPQLGIEEAGSLGDLFLWIIEGNPIEAHNAWFERGIWRNIMVPRYGWPSIDPRQWMCSAAKAAACALPRSLDDAITALRLPVRKDMEGSKLMMKLAKPRKPRKKELEQWKVLHGRKRMPVLYYESLEWFERLWAYCRQDVLAEEHLSERLPDLSDFEQDLYLFDQMINERGFGLDPEAIETALWLLRHESGVLNQELQTLTDGTVEKATQRQRLIDWFSGQGLDLPNTQKETIEDLLTYPEGIPGNVLRALEILRALGRSSTAKYQAMKEWICPDHRIHGGLLFHAATTGRWSGQGVQPHNFPRGTIKDPMDLLWEFLNTRDVEAIVGQYGSVTEPLSTALRGAIVASPGQQLFVADYSSIEARGLLWLAQDDESLDIFRRGDDIYCEMASSIYGRPITKDDKDERQLGKVAILGLGYQMGAPKFVDTAASYGITLEEDFAAYVVATYRDRFSLVKQLWYDVEETALQAMERPKMEIRCGRLTWLQEGRFLFCILPSGRRLAYPDPKVQTVTTHWGQQKDALTFMGVNGYSHKWVRQHTYGGSLVENMVQAISRDIMAAAMVRVERSKRYRTLFTVHDELVTEAHPAIGSVADFVQLVTTLPDWATEFPVAAEGYMATRYHK